MSNTPPTDPLQEAKDNIESFAPIDNELDELLLAVYNRGFVDGDPLAMYDKPLQVRRAYAKIAILTYYIKKSDVLDIVMGALPKKKPHPATPMDVVVDGSIDRIDGYNDALTSAEQALTTALKGKI